MDMYREYILDLYRNPLNKKELIDYDMRHRALNPTCGDEIDLMIKLDGDIIGDIGHIGEGCAISQAAVSLLTEDIKGKKIDSVSGMTDTNMFEMLNIHISHTRFKCALLGLHALKGALVSHNT